MASTATIPMNQRTFNADIVPAGYPPLRLSMSPTFGTF